MNKSRSLVVIIAALVLFAFLLSLISFAQDSKKTQSSSTNKAGAASTPPSEGAVPSAPPTNKADTQTPRSVTAGPPQDFSKNTWDIPADADKTKNPVEANEESIAKGKVLFMTKEKGNCIFCHGETGAGNKENLPRLRRVPADLSDKDRMPTLSDGEIFWKITKGITGIMPSREKQLTEEERWHVVNFVRTLSATNFANN
jgi:mono/diheme cytochrome c family protein